MLKKPFIVCSAIECPSWNGGSQRCQRYATSNACHMRRIVPELKADGSALLSQEKAVATSIDQLKAANDRFFAAFPEFKSQPVPREIDQLDSPK